MSRGGMNDWSSQVRRSARTADRLAAVLSLSDDELRGIDAARANGFPALVPPHYLSLIDPDDPADPMRIQCIPSVRETVAAPLELDDSLAEERHTVAPDLVRRYPDRVLLLATDRCSIHCRHCTRRRRVGRSGPRAVPSLEPTFRWIEDHRDVREVLVSGGDPLVAPDRWIEAVLRRIRRIGHVELIRVGSRVPVTMPRRVTPSLCRILRRAAPLFLTTHFNHPRELSPAAVAACDALADAGIPVVNQAVLLRGVNDGAGVQAELSRALLRARVRPYYLMQCDAVTGTSHLRVPVRRGLEIMEALRRTTTGLGIPAYVLDLPGGAGKVVLDRSSMIRREGDALVLRSPGGGEVRYPDPLDRCR